VQELIMLKKHKNMLVKNHFLCGVECNPLKILFFRKKHNRFITADPFSYSNGGGRYAYYECKCTAMHLVT
jgi:hypothetical protein